MSRRTVVRGVAWSAPAVMATAAVPALAISGTLHTVTVTGNGITGKSQTVTLPAGAHDITYSVSGGGGGSAVDDFDTLAGSGSKITGTLASSCTGPVTLWVMAGGGGDESGSPATGYGNGGLAQVLQTPNFSGAYLASTAFGGTGGAGSAIFLNAAPTSGGVPVVVAGGGGGGGSRGNSDQPDNMAPTSTNNPSGGVGGTAGQDVVDTYAPGTVTAGGGGAGPAGSAGSTTITPASKTTQVPGAAGQANGAGNMGGGNGAKAVTTSYQYTTGGYTYYLGLASGGGGGGWTGGGSGGVSMVDNKAMFPKASAARDKYAIVGTAGTGGGGANYTPASAGCLTNSVSAVASAGNGGSNVSGTGNGGPGTVTISYYSS